MSDVTTSAAGIRMEGNRFEPNDTAARHHLAGAIGSLSRICVDNCGGSEDLPGSLRDSVRKAFHDLLKVRDDIGW